MENKIITWKFPESNSRNAIIHFLQEMIIRETGVEDDAGCDWFTLDNETYIGGVDWLVSKNEEVAKLVNALNALEGHPELINQVPHEEGGTK